MKKSPLYILIALSWFVSCSTGAGSKNVKEKPAELNKVIKKPPSASSDTLLINFPAAVFYHPDSIQLMGLKATTDFMVYDGTMHEFFYQMRNARMVIQKAWPALRIVEAKNCRYLLFIKKDNTKDCIDLDSKPDPYGLFVFNEIKPPLLIDMTNIETQVSFYLKQ